VATPEGTRPRLRPLSLGEILDVSIKIVIRNGPTLFRAVLVVVVPVQIVSTLLTADYTVDSLDFSANADQTPEETLEELNQYLGGLAISTILQALAVLLASAACFRAIAQAYLGEKPDWRSSLSYGLQRAPSLLLLALLYGLGVVLGTLALVVPGVWLYVAWAFAMPALLVEGLRGRGALRRSFQLVRASSSSACSRRSCRRSSSSGSRSSPTTARWCSCSAGCRGPSALLSERRFRPRC
jgi:hypothetical protein